MERHCKIRGESLRNRDVLNEDRISDLPEALILRILSLLPTYTVIATSVLSKRWKSIWKMMPNLEFNSDRHHVNNFPEDVCSSLILYKASVLESLKLRVRYKCHPLKMGLPIPIAFSRNLRKLVMIVEAGEDKVKFPGIVFRCSNTLQILKLKGAILVDLTSPVCLNSLKELHLIDVSFKDEESVSNLLCGCPRLQDLVMHLDYFVTYIFTIAMPSLQRLTLKINYWLAASTESGSYVINAPSLKYLNINLFERLESCRIENAPELVEAKIFEVSNAVNVNILESLTSAKRLSLCLSPLKIKYLASKIFDQLLSLELQTNLEEWWKLLTLMLNSSPKLQILKLIDINHLVYVSDKPVPIAPKWNQPKCVPECLLFHLETFVWTGYQWERENEKELAAYILKNARHLKKAALCTLPTKKLEKRREMLNQLANEVRASNSCHLVFEFDQSYCCDDTDSDLDL